jgi:hypothetical protein
MSFGVLNEVLGEVDFWTVVIWTVVHVGNTWATKFISSMRHLTIVKNALNGGGIHMWSATFSNEYWKSRTPFGRD